MPLDRDNSSIPHSKLILSSTGEYYAWIISIYSFLPGVKWESRHFVFLPFCWFFGGILVIQRREGPTKFSVYREGHSLRRFAAWIAWIPSTTIRRLFWLRRMSSIPNVPISYSSSCNRRSCCTFRCALWHATSFTAEKRLIELRRVWAQSWRQIRWAIRWVLIIFGYELPREYPSGRW